MTYTSNNVSSIHVVWQKAVAIICFALLASALLLSYAHPANGYELDIYSSTPTMVWISIILSFFGGAGIILYQVITKSYEHNRIWLIGLSIIILSRIVLLYIPYIRGYVSWQGDNIGYLGMIKDVLLAGHFTSDNIYPITHIFLSSMIYVTGISDTTVANLSTALISILFILFVYLFVGITTHDKRKQLLSVMIAGIVMLTAGYNVILSPNGWSILFIPLLFYLYFKYSNLGYRILLIIILVIYPFFHPLSALIVVIALFILEFTKWIFTRAFKSNIATSLTPTPFLIIYVVIEFMLLSVWILSHQQFNPNLMLAWQQITSGLWTGKVSELAGSLNKINVHGIDFYILLFKMFGADIILIIASIAGIMLLLRRARSTVRDTPALLPLACVFMLCGFLYASYLLGLPGTGALGTGQWDRRLLGYLDVLIPLLSVIILGGLLLVAKMRNLARISFVCLIILSSILSIACLYNSPFVNQPNPQITLMDIAGIKWFINNKDINVGCVSIASEPGNLANGIIGYAGSIKRTDLNTTQFTDHFGYSLFSNLGDQYSTDKYTIVIEADRIVYSTVWQQVGRFNTSDFENLNRDTTADLLFSNGETQCYYIHTKASPP